MYTYRVHNAVTRIRQGEIDGRSVIFFVSFFSRFLRSPPTFHEYSPGPGIHTRAHLCVVTFYTVVVRRRVCTSNARAVVYVYITPLPLTHAAGITARTFYHRRFGRERFIPPVRGNRGYAAAAAAAADPARDKVHQPFSVSTHNCNARAVRVSVYRHRAPPS